MAFTKSPGGTLTCKGKFTVNSIHKDKTYIFEIHVIDNNIAYKMGLVTMVASINENLGKLTGCMKSDPVKIMLRDNVVLYCTPIALCILFQILPKVKKELHHSEEDDILEKVTEPKDWCSPIVPIRKQNIDVRVCVELKELNSVVYSCYQIWKIYHPS